LQIAKLVGELYSISADNIKSGPQFNGTLRITAEDETLKVIKKYLAITFEKDGEIDDQEFACSISERLIWASAVQGDISGDEVTRAEKGSEVRDLLKEVFAEAKEIFSGNRSDALKAEGNDSETAPSKTEVLAEINSTAERLVSLKQRLDSVRGRPPVGGVYIG
jgi:hypothetical protein